MTLVFVKSDHSNRYLQLSIFPPISNFLGLRNSLKPEPISLFDSSAERAERADDSALLRVQTISTSN